MSPLKWVIPLALSIGGIGASAADLQPELNFGAPVAEAELARYLAIPPSPTSGFGETKLFCIRRIGVLVVTMAVASTSARA